MSSEQQAPQQNIKLAVDAVVFGYAREHGLSVLLIQRKEEPFQGMWALPGGLVLNEESLDEAVERELAEEAGVTINYLEQLYTFGAPRRDPRNRVVSVTYFGLVRKDKFMLHASTDAQDAAWFAVDKLPALSFDHQQIIQTALQRLQGKLTYQPIGFDLLEEKFPFSDLEHLYSSVLGRPIDRRNFKKKVMQFGILQELDEQLKTAGAGRPARLYRFQPERYKELTQKGLHFEV